MSAEWFGNNSSSRPLHWVAVYSPDEGYEIARFESGRGWISKSFNRTIQNVTSWADVFPTNATPYVGMGKTP